MKFFITGISRGLGKAIADECISRGHEVWGVARTKPAVINGEINFRQCDISNYAGVEEICKEMIRVGYVPDVVILNAAVVEEDLANGIDLKMVKEVFETNFFGNLHWIKLLLPYFSSRKEGGIFINISSVSAIRGVGNNMSVSYPASKSAMDMIFEGLRVHCKNKRTRFITINFGPIGDIRKAPFISTTYRQAAQKVVSHIQGKMIRNTFSYPAITGFIYRASMIVPDSLLRQLYIVIRRSLGEGRD